MLNLANSSLVNAQPPPSVGGAPANQSDFLGEGLARPARAPIPATTPLQEQEAALARARFNATQNNVPYGTPISQGGSAQGWQVTPTALGTGGTAYVARAGDYTGPNQAFTPNGQTYYQQYDAGGNRIESASTLSSPDANGMPINAGDPGFEYRQPGAGPAAGSTGGGTGLGDQVNAARATGQGFVGYGDTALNRTQQQANNLLAAGQAYNPQAQSVAPGFGVGQRGAGPSMVDPSGLGALQTNIAGQLGAAPKVGNVANVAGKLGAAPQVNRANVGMIQNGAAPGAVTPQLGNQGASNADQQGMLARLNGFLDAGPGPSIAEAQLRQSQASNMADLIGAARSGRGGAGSQAQALRGAMSEGSAIMSDTAGQLGTLRAQEEDMLKNRQLNAIGLGGQMATAQRGQDLGFRGQNLAALQGDQATSLGARGQDIQSAMSNQGAQLGLEQLQAQTALGARGQNLSALQGDQSTGLGIEGLRAQTALGARGQNLAALQSDQGAQLGARGQTLSALQGNQGAELGARGQDVQARAQDLAALTGDADRGLAAQQLGLQGQLGLGGLGLQAQGQGLQYSSQQNALGLGAEGMAQEAINSNNRNLMQQAIASGANATQLQLLQNQLNAQPTFGEQLAGNMLGGVGNALSAGIIGSIFQPQQGLAPPNTNYNPGPYGGPGGVY